MFGLHAEVEVAAVAAHSFDAALDQPSCGGCAWGGDAAAAGQVAPNALSSVVGQPAFGG